MVHRDEKRACFHVVCPTCDYDTWLAWPTASIHKLLHSVGGPDPEFPSVARCEAAGLSRILHDHMSCRAAADRKLLRAQVLHVRAGVPLNVVRKDQPILVVDKGRLHFVTHFRRLSAQFRLDVGHTYWLAIFVFRLEGN